MASPLPTATAVVRRYLVLIATTLLAAGTLTLAAAPARAALTAVHNGITFYANPATPDAGASATGYDAAFGTEVTIPATVDIGGTDHPVTTIGRWAFHNDGLTKVSLPDTLTSIGGSAFSENQLTSVTLPDGLTTLGDLAFHYNELTSVTVPDSITDISYAAFHHNQLASVTLPDTLTTIGRDAFSANPLTAIEIPAGVTEIGDSAFADNSQLTRVRFTGPAPTTITAGGQTTASLGTATGLTVGFPAQYRAQGDQPGYTTPLWQGYTTMSAYTVSFDTGDGSAVEPVTVWPGEVLDLPAAPVREGYTFTGWYTTPELETPFDPQAPLAGDVTVHAGWAPVSGPVIPDTPATGSLSAGSIEDFLVVVLGLAV